MNTAHKYKSLHTCNVANVAYGYCKILNNQNIEALLRCHDLLHLMSQPEWEDLELSADDFLDENNFYNNKADFGSYIRPPWYLSESIFPIKSKSCNDIELSIQKPGNTSDWTLFERTLVLARRILPALIKQRLLQPAYNLSSLILLQLNNEQRKKYQEFIKNFNNSVKIIENQSMSYGEEWKLERKMLSKYKAHTWWLNRYAEYFPVLFSYIYSPIYAMLLNSKPFVSVEIGTIREIPFDGTDIGKMLAMAYRKSHHVVITNPDVNIKADKLGIKEYTFCPHPLDEDKFIPQHNESSFKKELKERNNVDSIMFAPARQNWRLKGNDKYIKAFSSFIKDGNKSILIIPAWGQEINRSKKLCEELNIGDNVIWIQPQSEKSLIKYYQAADIVLDQFMLNVFGLITPKAMSCGAVVLTSYDPILHKWCYQEDPPIVPCSTIIDIYHAMKNIIGDEVKKNKLSKKAREWVCKYNSKKVVKKTLDIVSEKAVERFNIENSMVKVNN